MKPVTFVAGQQLPAASLNSDFDTIYTGFNGNISSANIAANAAIPLTKIDLNSEAFNKQLAGNHAWAAGVTGDNEPRISLETDGYLVLGAGGGTAPDVGLQRSAVNTIRLFVPGGGTPALNMNSGAITNGGAFTATSLTLSVTPLSPDNGGTGLSSYTAGDLITATGATTLSKLAKGTGNQILGMNNGATTQEYKTVTAGTGIDISHGVGSVTITASSGLTGSYFSSAQTITANTVITLAHGLGAVPKMMGWQLVCISTNLGYAVGDVISIVYGGSGLDGPHTLIGDATNVYIAFPGTTTYLARTLSAGPHPVSAIDNTKWKVLVWAFK